MALRKLVGRTLLLLALALLAHDRDAVAQERPLLVFAAASVKTALDEIDALYRQRTGRAVSASYAASSALARQIEAGAPADVFLSADLDWMDHVARKGLVRPDTRANLLGNRLVLIAPTSHPVQLAIGPGFALAQALGARRLALADPTSVPAGKYAKAALESLGVWSQIADRLAPAENVRAALLLVARGETPLGIVYQTDAAAEPTVRIVGSFPADSHPPIVYPVALTHRAAPAALDYLGFLKSPAARVAFEKQGFTPVE
jgi:molybdate transport system substrate-binding protein